MTGFNIDAANQEYQNANPKGLIEHAYANFDDCWISFSGAEDVILIDMAVKAGIKPKVFSLDTGRLHKETYLFIEAVRKHYDTKIQILSPDTELVEKLVEEKGLYSFYQDGHKECCAVRKVDALKRKLGTVDAWITGQRKDQSKDTRAELNVAQQDHFFAGEGRTLVKFNPLAEWSSEQVWTYIRENGVPYNALHEQGFTSIGCEPCTRPVLPNQHEREGRWWWEEASAKECGLHAINVKPA